MTGTAMAESSVPGNPQSGLANMEDGERRLSLPSPPGLMVVQSSLLAAPARPPPAVCCLPAKNLLVISKPREESATSIVSRQQVRLGTGAAGEGR